MTGQVTEYAPIPSYRGAPCPLCGAKMMQVTGSWDAKTARDAIFGHGASRFNSGPDNGHWFACWELDLLMPKETA